MKQVLSANPHYLTTLLIQAPTLSIGWRLVATGAGSISQEIPPVR